MGETPAFGLYCQFLLKFLCLYWEQFFLCHFNYLFLPPNKQLVALWNLKIKNGTLMMFDSLTQVISRLTKDIVETYKICNPQFQYSEELNPKRFLTSPSIGVLNDGHDNANSDLILAVNLVLVNSETQRRFDTVTYSPSALLKICPSLLY